VAKQLSRQTLGGLSTSRFIMDVILDSNIYISDYWMQSQNFRFLKDYINKTKSSILLPSVVLEEVKGKFNNDLLKYSQQLVGVLDNLSRYKVALISHEEIEKSVLESKEKFINELEYYFLQYHSKYIPLSIAATNEAISRAINRIPPCKESGEGLRDALIWMQILEYLETNKKDQKVAFICQNKHDFAQQDGKQLKSKLIDDLRERKIDLLYYSDIEVFLREYAKPIAHITKEWLEETINISAIKDLVLQFMKPPHSYEIRKLFSIQSSDYEHSYKISDDIEDIRILDINIDDYIVWEFDNNNIEIRIDYFASIDGTATCELSSIDEYSTREEVGTLWEYTDLDVLAEVYVSVRASLFEGKLKVEQIENIGRA
jgi:hypothetical protein